MSDKQQQESRQGRATERSSEITNDALPAGALTRRQLLQAAVGGTGLAFLAACSGASPTREASKPAAGASPAASGGAAQRGGQIVFAVQNDPTGLNPLVGNNSTVIYFGQLVFDGLTRPDDSLQPTPALATSWDVAPDGLGYTFHLRRDVRFHDGEPLTAADVKYSWEAIVHPGNKSANYTFFNRIKGAEAFRAGNADGVSGITTPDDHTVRVEMDAPYAPFVALSAFFPIVPKHVYGSVPVDEMERHATNRAPVGTGPFRLGEWRANEYLAFDANPNYWGGRPKLDRLITKSVPDSTTLPSLLRAGSVDVIGLYRGLAPLDYDGFARDSNFRVHEMAGYSNWYIEFNLANPLFADVRVRRALMHALDRQGIVKDYLLGHGKVVNTAIHPNSWGYTEPTTQHEFSLDKARALLREAGWTPGPDGILVKDGRRFSFEFATFLPDYPELVQEQWKRVGVECQLKRTDFSGFWGPTYLQKKHEVAGLHVIMGIYTDPDYPLPTYFSSRLNRNAYSNPKVDELIQGATATLDQAERKRRYAEFLEAMAQDVPHIWVAMPNEIWAMTTRVRLPNKNLSFLMLLNAKDWERTA